MGFIVVVAVCGRSVSVSELYQNYHRDEKGEGCAENFQAWGFQLSVQLLQGKMSHKFKPVEMGAHLSCVMRLSCTEEPMSSSDGLMAFCKRIVSSSFMEMSSLSRSSLSHWTSVRLKTSRRPLLHKHRSSRLSC